MTQAKPVHDAWFGAHKRQTGDSMLDCPPLLDEYVHCRLCMVGDRMQGPNFSARTTLSSRSAICAVLVENRAALHVETCST